MRTALTTKIMPAAAASVRRSTKRNTTTRTSSPPETNGGQESLQVYKATASDMMTMTMSNCTNDNKGNSSKLHEVTAVGATLHPLSTTQNVVIRLDVHPHDILEHGHDKVLAYNETEERFSQYQQNDDEKQTNDTDDVPPSEVVERWPQPGGVQCCMWCCHPVDGVPIGIPTNTSYVPTNVQDVTNVQCTGHFCSYECAAAYNFSAESGSITHATFERYSLLNALANKGPDEYVLPAPDRWTLNMFGGSMNIQEFRAGGKHFAMHQYPLISKQPQLEELQDDCSLLQHNRFVPVSPLSSSQKTNNNNNIIDADTMNVKIKKTRARKSIVDAIKLQVVPSSLEHA